MFFFKFPNPRLYPILKNCQTAILYSSLDDNHDLKKARQALIKRIGKTFSLKKYKRNSLCSSGVNDYPHGIVELHDDIVSRQVCEFILKDFNWFISLGT